MPSDSADAISTVPPRLPFGRDPGREPVAVGRIILNALTARRLTQSEVNGAMGWSSGFLSNIIYGNRAIPKGRLDELAKAMFLDGEEHEALKQADIEDYQARAGRSRLRT